MDQPCVVSVSAHPKHSFSKPTLPQISLRAGLGVLGDAHCGKTVKHRSRVAQNPDQPNLRQVHLIHAELFDELSKKGFSVEPGELGENMTTRGIDLLSLPVGTKLRFGTEAVVELTGLRNPCGQIDNFQKGLLNAVLDRDSEGNLIRKAGVMGVVLTSGSVQPGDRIEIELPELPHKPLERI
jgi:MOSC domain-containing protein YiiM